MKTKYDSIRAGKARKMKTETKHTPEMVMAHFNLSDESFDALPRGLAAELGTAINELTTLRADKAELLSALQEAKGHLEYCNYGDNYEREGTEPLKLQLEQAIAKASGERNNK